MTRFHITPEGEAKECRARVKCLYKIPETEHFATRAKAEAHIAEIAKEEAGAWKGLKRSDDAKRSAKAGEFTTYGVGSFKAIPNPKGKHWDPSLKVRSRPCENFPKQTLNQDSHPLEDYREIEINGEIVGYVMKTPRSDTWGFQSLEKANDPHAIHSFSFQWGSPNYAAKALVEHTLESRKPLTLPQGDYSANDHISIRGNTPRRKVKQIVRDVGEGEQLYVEEVDHGDAIYRNAFLIKNGRAVSFVKMSDMTYEDIDGNPTRVTQRCDVETRRIERGKGYASKLSKHLEKLYDNPLSSGGTFTEDGYRAFGNNPHQAPGSKYEDWRPSIPAMNFVEDWDLLRVQGDL